jgi:hypothetical protein
MVVMKNKEKKFAEWKKFFWPVFPENETNVFFFG